MAKEGAKTGSTGDVKVFVSLPEFVESLILADSVGTIYFRNVSTNDSYAGRDMASGQSVLYNSKCLKLAALDCQYSSLIEAS